MDSYNKKILRIFSLVILIGVPFIKFLSLEFQKYNILTNYDSINPAIILYLSVPILLFIYIKNIKDTKRKLGVYDYIFFALILSGILSTIFSIDKITSIFGSFERHEGFLSVLSYYLLFINWKFNGNKKDIKDFIKLVVIIAIINSIYSLFQIYTDFNFIIRYTKEANMASGFCSNPNFLGSLIVTILSIVICNFLINNKSNIKEYLILILLFITLINCESTGPFIALIVTLIFLGIFLYKKRNLIIKKLFILFIVLISTYLSIYFINKYIFHIERCELCNINESIKNGEDLNKMSSGRITIWKNSLNIIKDNFFFGVGYDNFYLAYPNPKISLSYSFEVKDDGIKKVKPEIPYIVDNAHNIYIHIFSTTGVFGLIPYLILCLLTFVNGLKSKDNLVFLLLSGFVAYCIQAFCNINVILIVPIFYIIIGLILSQNN